MEHLLGWQYAAIAVIFIWSGFVRTGLGFGGAVLALPFLLLIYNEPLVFLPIISIQLLIFSSWITWRSARKAKRDAADNTPSKPQTGTIAWRYLRTALSIMIIPKLIGVFGLLTLPNDIVTGVIFVIISVFAVSYIIDKPFYSENPIISTGLLMLGGYVSGTSLIGAPLMVSVFASKVPRHQLRDTLFVLWFILVCIKMVSFVIAGVDLQLIHQLWLLPCAYIGHLIGERFHERIQKAETPTFFRIVGWALLLVSIFGLFSTFGASS